jgi:hypothetical protein
MNMATYLAMRWVLSNVECGWDDLSKLISHRMLVYENMDDELKAYCYIRDTYYRTELFSSDFDEVYIYRPPEE